MKVLLISHTCQSLTEGQPKAECLGKIPGIELLVLTPKKWMHYGKWREASAPTNASYKLRIEPVRFPWLLGAQYYMHHYTRLKSILQEFKPDVIDLWEEPWGLVSAHTCWLAKRILPDVKIITETEQNIDKKLPPPFEWFRTYTLKTADAAVGRNRESIAIIRRKGFDGNASVVPNAIDPTLFIPLDRQTAKKEWGVTSFTAGYVGRLVPEKGILDFLQAVSMCPDNIHAMIAGEGPQLDEINTFIKDHNLGERVKLAGLQPLEKLPSFMNALDVLVLPSRTTARWKEQFGRVLIEAHACGTPVIGSNSGAIPDVVGEGGLVFEEGNVEALKHAMQRMADDPAWSLHLGEQGRAYALSNCTWQAVAQQMFDIYKSTLRLGA